LLKNGSNIKYFRLARKIRETSAGIFGYLFFYPGPLSEKSPVQGGVQAEIPQEVLIADQVENQLAQLFTVQIINQKVIDTPELFGLGHGFVY
jgi:predicted component of type VI protein secretion system